MPAAGSDAVGSRKRISSISTRSQGSAISSTRASSRAIRGSTIPARPRHGDEGQGRRLLWRDVAGVHGVFAQPGGDHAAQLVLGEPPVPPGSGRWAAARRCRAPPAAPAGPLPGPCGQQPRVDQRLARCRALPTGGVGGGDLAPQRPALGAKLAGRVREGGRRCWRRSSGQRGWGGLGHGSQCVIHRDGCVVRNFSPLVNVFSARQLRDPQEWPEW